MRQAIYNLLTRQLIYVTNPNEEAIYDPNIEGVVEVADVYIGDIRWCDKHLAFEDVTDPNFNIAPYIFLQKFSLSERLSIFQEAKENNIIVDMLFLILTSPTIHLCSDTVKGAFDYLISDGLITPERVIQIRGY